MDEMRFHADVEGGCVVMRNVIYQVYTRYSTHVVDESSYFGADGFLSGKQDEKLMLKFEKA